MFFEARSLFVNYKTQEIKEGDQILDFLTNFNQKLLKNWISILITYFSSFDEFKKLYIFDSKKKRNILNVLNNFTEIDKYYVFKDIQSYTIGEMDKLLEEIIEHYSHLVEPDLLEVKLEPDGREYKKNYIGRTRGENEKRKKPKKPKEKNKIRKKNLNNM